MNRPILDISRRTVLKGAGSLVVAFGLPLPAWSQAGPNPKYEALDAWLAVGKDGGVTVFCGKVELGTGIKTAMAQLAADELDVALEHVNVVMGDTDLCPDQGTTTGSRSILAAGPELRRAAAEARQALVLMASHKLGVPVEQLNVEDGVVSGPQGQRVSYAELVGGRHFDQKMSHTAKVKAPDKLRVVGKAAPRAELPGKIFGSHIYIQNLRVPGMVHARVLRPPAPGAVLERVEEGSLQGYPADVQVVTKGNFVAVVAEQEHDAVRAARALKVHWRTAPTLPDMPALPAALQGIPSTPKVVATAGNVEAGLGGAARTHHAQYTVPFQLHGSIGPSCAVAEVKGDRATVWSPTQSSFNTRDCIATLLGMPPERVHVVWIEGSGCYGHNGADDASADAALLSQLIGKPVRLQWMRQNEHTNEPMGVPMVMEVRAGLDASSGVVAWDYQVWSASHSSRPVGKGPGNTLAGAELGLAKSIGSVGADRNAKNSYAFANQRVVLHLLQHSLLRVSALRGLGSPQNTFANESFIDELAALAGADPIAYRVRHLKDERAIAVLEAVAKLSQWDARPSPRADRASGQGRGVAMVQYDNSGAYVGLVVRVKVDRGTGKVRVERVSVAHDCGLIVNPDGVRNQIEGNVIQGISRALLEEVQFDRAQVTSSDWLGYPILRFNDLPETVDIELINRPQLPALGVGEPAITPMFAAIANAIHDATGARLRNMPFTAERVKMALPA